MTAIYEDGFEVIDGGQARIDRPALTVVTAEADNDLNSGANVLSDEHMTYLIGEGIERDVALAVCRSVYSVEDLPEDLRWVASDPKNLPGILFTHTTPDGRRIGQYRPDSKDVESKYVFPKGCGSVLSLHPTMRERVGTAKQLVVVEGTKQYLSAVSYAAEGDLLVGIQGCRNYSEGGVAVPELDGLLVGDEPIPVVCIFDADAFTNRNVYDAAEDFGLTMTVLGAKAVSYGKVPGGGKSGLDDFLKMRDIAIRPVALSNIIAQAKPLPKAKPKAREKALPPMPVRSQIAPTIDVDAAVVREPSRMRWDGKANDYVEEPGQVLLEAAPTITRTIVITNDLDETVPDEIRHEMEIVLFPGAKPLRLRDSVPDAMLTKTEQVLERVPHGMGTHIGRASSPGWREQVAAAVRAHARGRAETATSYRRLGYVDSDVVGEIGYLHQGGLITETGHRTDVSAATRYVLIDYTDAAEKALDRENLIDAIRQMLGVRTLLKDRTAFWTVFGYHMLVHTGAVPRGSIAVIGKPGSGKSYLTKLFQSMESPAYSPKGGREMLTFASATGGVAAQAGIGLHHSVLYADDIRDLRDEDPTAHKQQMFGAKILINRGYQGPGAHRARLVQDRATGIYEEASVDQAWCGMVLTAECLPDPEQADQTLERLLSVPVEYSTSLIKGAAAKIDVLAKSGLPQIVQVGWLREIMRCAREIHGGSMAALWASLDRVRDGFATGLGYQYEQLTARNCEVAAAPLVGVEMALQWMCRIGAITEAEYEEMGDEAETLIHAAAVRHAEAEMADKTPASGRLLNRIMQLLASGGRHVLIGVDDRGREARQVGPGVESIGKVAVVADNGGNQVSVVALLPDIVAKALGMPRGEAVTRTLRDIAVRDKEGHTSRPLTIGGRTVRAVCVPSSLFDGLDDATMRGATEEQDIRDKQTVY